MGLIYWQAEVAELYTFLGLTIRFAVPAGINFGVQARAGMSGIMLRCIMPPHEAKFAFGRAGEYSMLELRSLAIPDVKVIRPDRFSDARRDLPAIGFCGEGNSS